MPRSRSLALALCALALLPAGCGGDEEPRVEPPPELTLPQSRPGTETETAPQTAPQTDTTGTQTTPSGGGGTQTSPSGGGSGGGGPGDSGSGGTPGPGGRRQQDSPEKDTPPPRGSPEERFERFCEENPGACG